MRGLVVGWALSSVVAIGLLAAPGARAQTTVQVSQGGRAAAGASVSALINGIKQPVGTTDASGRITIADGALAIGAGTAVDVYAKTCTDGQVEVILVPQGEKGQCAGEGAEVGEDCGCRKAGAFVWGQTGPVAVNVPAAGSALASGWNTNLRAKVNFSRFLDLENVAGDQKGITTNSVDDSGIGYSVGLSQQLALTPVYLGVGYDYSKATYDQTYGNGQAFSGEMKVHSFDTSLGYRINWGWRTHVELFGGFAVVYNTLDILPADGSPGFNRTQTGLRGLGGIEFGFHPAREWGILVGGNYRSGGSNDADNRLDFGVGVCYTLGGGR